MAGLAALVAAIALIAAPGMAHAGGFRFRGCVTADDRVGPHGSGACELMYSAGLLDLTSLASSNRGATQSLYTGASMDCRGRDDVRCFTPAAVGRFKLRQQSGALRFRDCLTGASNIRSCDQVPGAARNACRAGLGAVNGLAASRDGRSIYAASNRIVCVVDEVGVRTCHGSNVLTTFSREVRTGALTYQACVTGDERSGPAGSGACAQIPSATAQGFGSGLDQVFGLTVGQGGKALYATGAGDSSLVAFDRDPNTGVLQYSDCLTGSVKVGDKGACALLPKRHHARAGLRDANSLAVATDAVYAGGRSGIAQFNPGPPSGPLEFVRTYRHVHAPLALRAGDKNLYAALDYGLVRFKRDDRSGRLVRAGCVTGAKMHRPRHCRLSPTATRTGEFSGLGFPVSLAVSGRSVYVASEVDSAVARLAAKRRR